MIESSRAIKCPSVGVFLSGMKIFQEYITNDENLSEIMRNDHESCNQLKAVFGEYYSLSSDVSKYSSTLNSLIFNKIFSLESV